MITWDKTLFDDLCESIKKGECYAFVGAGMSASLGYPNWEALIRELAAIYISNETVEQKARDELSSLISQNNLPLNCLNLIKRSSPRSFIKKLVELFSPKEPNNFSQAHADLLNIPILKGIITTNYDSCIEDAARSINKQYRNVESISDLSANDFCIYHIHGTIFKPDSLVVTGDDYIALYNDSFKSALREFLSSKVILYLGYSIRDIQIAEILQQKTAIEKQTPHIKDHYGLFPFSDSFLLPDIFYNDYGIRVQKYPNDNGHRNLNDLLMQLRGAPLMPTTTNNDILTEVK